MFLPQKISGDYVTEVLANAMVVIILPYMYEKSAYCTPLIDTVFLHTCSHILSKAG